MGESCPLCHESDQVKSLSGHWGDLNPGAANYEKLRQPAAIEVHYLYAVGVALLGVAFMAAGGVVPGLLALLAGAGWGVVMNRQATDNANARARWERSKWCERCAEVFDPKGF